MHHIETEIAWPSAAHQSVHICAIHIAQSARPVDHIDDFRDPRFEESDGVGHGEHEDGNRIVQLASKYIEVDRPVEA